MMRQLLSNIQQFPLIGMSVLVIFSVLFGYIVFETLRKRNKEAFHEAAHMPLDDQENI